MNLGLNGKVAIVTGGARGIGSGIAHALAAEGCSVAVVDRHFEVAKDVADTICAKHGKASPFQVEVTQGDSVKALALQIASSLGDPDILVNNAGFSMDAPLVEMTDEQWDAVVNVNLKGTWLCAREFVPGMRRKGAGRIINISSRAHFGTTNKVNYCSAKAGIIGLTSALSIELGPDNITVNSVAPGLVLTERVTKIRYFADIERRTVQGTPIKRIGRIEDVAGAVVYLASDLASFVSGETIHVTGGLFSSI